MKHPECIFCGMVEGTVPHHVVWSNETHLAFLSIFPNTKGVTVVIPKEHHDSYLFRLDDTIITELMLATKKVARILDGYFQDSDRCGVVFEGFGVNHLHAKLFPLHGTKLENWEPIESGSQNNQYFETYPGYIASNNSELADANELAELAAELRSLAQEKNMI